MTAIQPRPGIMDIAPYKGGDSCLPGVDRVLKLSSNENPVGPSPAAVAALTGAAAGVHRYPSTDHAGLRRAIAEVHGLDAERIICGAGSDEIIAFLCQVYGGPGSEVMSTRHGFSMYRISALASGATPVEVDEADRRVDIDKILAGVTDRTRLVFVTNPANPAGTLVGGQDLVRLADSLPDHALLVIDSAYAEFAEGYDGGAALVDIRDNVVMTRTFSKLYGLGGLRVGWGYGPAHVIDALNRVRGPFNLGVTQLAAAEAAVRDRAWADEQTRANARQRAALTARLRASGVACDTSHANFVLARFADGDTAARADEHLRGHGIIVRRVIGYGFPEGLRITVGTEEDCDRVASAVEMFMGAE